MNTTPPPPLITRAGGPLVGAVTTPILAASVSAIALILIFWRWRPLAGMLWQIRNPLRDAILSGGFGFSLLLVLAGALLFDHFGLFGTETQWRNSPGMTNASREDSFST